MRISGLRLSLLAITLVVVSALVGYAVAAVVDEDDASPRPSTETDGSTTTPDGGPAAVGPQPPDGQTIVVSALGLVGWWNGTAWVANDGPDAPAEPGLGFTYLPLEGPPTPATGAALTSTCEITTGQPFVELTPPFSGENVLAVSGVARPLPRRVEQLDRASDTYRAAATEALATVGIVDAEPDLEQLLRIDIDGDGSDEVLLTVERQSGDTLVDAEAGDYSAVVVRRLAGSGVVTQVLSHSIGDSDADGSGGLVFVEQYRIAAVADLNGDGTLEVAVSSTYYEGSGLAVFGHTKGGDLRSVLTVGCGA